MRGLMRIAQSKGISVSGSDWVYGGHGAGNISADVGLVVYSGAIALDNVELVEAKKRGIPTVERGEYLGRLCGQFGRVIAVAGTHGKTTTSAMLGCIMAESSLHFGGSYVTNGERVDGVRVAGTTLITEACEYKRSMLHISGGIAVITNVDFDHPDCYKDKADYMDAFVDFARGHRTVIHNGDDAKLRGIGANRRTITFGLGEDNDYCAVDISTNPLAGSAFGVVKGDEYLGKVSLKLFGLHNVVNALCAITAAHTMGTDWDTIANRLKDFGGLERRLERLENIDNRAVYLDYAHHPDEIACAAAAFGMQPVSVVMQPHTYTRLMSLWERFGESLCGKNIVRVVVLDVYAAREVRPIDGKGSEEFCQYLSGIRNNVYYAPSFGDAKSHLLAQCSADETILLLGAGDVDRVIGG